MTVEAKFVPAYNPTTNNAELKPAWQEPPSSGAPTITALSAIGITATSAQPRISYS